MTDKIKVFMTGATGTMGRESVKEILKHPDRLELTVLARDSRKNHRLLDRLEAEHRLRVIWGDLLNYEDVARGVADADYVLHIGGMVSPMADHYPEQTRRVNVGAAENIVKAAKARPDGGEGVGIVYIGSVAELGNRNQPRHWGRAGDPVWAAKYDVYAQSKIDAERVIAESGLPRWVSLRQTGILAPDIVAKGSDPITFHVPVRGVLEWVTARDSGRLMANICLADNDESFWKRFYNIGGGRGFRMSNYEFEQRIMDAMSCPKPEKVFDANWFATRNFHGMWYEDSDELERRFHFRGYRDADEYFSEFKKGLPFYFKLAAIVPAPLIKMGMKFIATRKPLGTLSWVKGSNPGRLKAYFGGFEEWKRIPRWEEMDLSHPSEKPIRLDHGYDETLPESEIDLEQLRRAAEFRGGKCLATDMKKGDLDTPVEWECHAGHRFTATPRLVLLGGHWCGECMGHDADLDAEAEKNRFFAQVWK